MSSVINTNVKSIMAQNALVTNNRSLEKAMQQLSTGKRINGAKDDAAGLAISETMTAQIRGLNQAVRNANDAVSMVQTAEGALVEVTNMLQRMRELAVQSSNGTLDDTQRGYLGAEYDALVDAIDKVSANTTWNGMALLGDDADTYTMQVGADVDGTLDITFELADASTLGVAAGDIDDQTDANAMIGDLDTALGDVAGWRADLGAKANQLSFLADNLSNVSMNTAASRSRILDTDYAQATTELARTQIIQQAATAMLAQANQQPQAVLALLK
jgi:flagellin